MWASVSNSSHSMIVIKMSSLSSYHHPNINSWWNMGTYCVMFAQWFSELRRKWSETGDFELIYLEVEVWRLQCWCCSFQWLTAVAEQPSTHTVALSKSTDEPTLSEAAQWGLLVVRHVTQFGTGDRTEPTMASCSAPLEQIHPHPTSLDNYVPLLLITHSLDPPQLLSVVKFSSPGIFKKRQSFSVPQLEYHIQNELRCVQEAFSGSPPFLQQLSSLLVITIMLSCHTEPQQPDWEVWRPVWCWVWLQHICKFHFSGLLSSKLIMSHQIENSKTFSDLSERKKVTGKKFLFLLVSYFCRKGGGECRQAGLILSFSQLIVLFWKIKWESLTLKQRVTQAGRSVWV